MDAIAIQPDGKIIIGGDFLVYNGVSRIGIARLNADASLDTTFVPGNSIGLNSEVDAIAVQPDGKILIGGEFTTYQGFSRTRIARLNANATLDMSFVPGIGAEDDVLSIVIAADGKIVIGGEFTGYDTNLSPGIARLTSNGSFDPTFEVVEGMSGAVRGVAISEGKILVAGDFFSYNMVSRNAIARLNLDGSLDTTFNPGTGANDDAFAVAVQADGKILLGGDFTNYNGTARNYVARINPDGSLDMTFNPGMGANNPVRAILVQADGKILLGGHFTNYNGIARNGIARLNADGSLDTTFDPGTGLDGHIRAMALQSDGRICIGGAFGNYNDASRNSIAGVKGDLFITWPAGDSTNKSIQLPIVDDALSEGNETLTLTLTSLTGGATIGANSTQTLTIIDNDNPTPTPTPTGRTPSPTPTPTPTATPNCHDYATYLRDTDRYAQPPTATSTPTATPGTLGNISTRLRVLSGDNALIGGMIATGTAGKRVIIRAIGPSLIPFGVPGALANPTLDLFQGSTLLFSNDDWNTSTQQAEIAASGLAPSHNLESAIIWTLNPGQNYTAVVRGTKRRDRRGNSGSVRSGSSRGLEAGEHQHARICGRGRQRDDRGIDRGTGQRNEPQDPGASARTDAERLWGRRSLGESDARSGEFEWDGDSLEQRLERRPGPAARRLKRPG